MKMHTTLNGKELLIKDIKDCAMLKGTKWESFVGNVYFLEDGQEVFQSDIGKLFFK